MSNVIKVRIQGNGVDNDAPTVNELTEQLSDYFNLLETVEKVIADDGEGAISWRVVHAQTASPITFTVEATARQFAVNVDTRAGHVINHTLYGVNQLQSGSERPRYFTDQALKISQKLFERVTNGLDLTDIETGNGQVLAKITPSTARRGTQNIRSILRPTARPYKEFGSVEGIFRNVGQDGYERRILTVRSRLTDEDIKCIVKGEAAKQLSRCEVGDIWSRRRLEVSGLIHFRSPGRIHEVEAYELRFLRSRDELPTTDEIIDENFTGDLRTEEYLKRLRNGSLS